MSDEGAAEQSLLEDASTLLMFSKTRSASGSNDTEDLQNKMHQVKQPQATTIPAPIKSENVSPRNPSGSLGPASIAMLPRDGAKARRSESLSPTSGGRQNERGIVAAAALAAAATVPLPLQPGQRRKGSHEVNADDNMESRIKGEWLVPDSYIVDIDSGIISCICGFSDDDGFTIQCDHCNRWQHAVCYNIRDIETAPEDHLCNTCQPRKLDSKRARRKQVERLQRLNGNKSSSSLHRGGKSSSASNDKSRGSNSNRASMTDDNDNERLKGTESNNTSGDNNNSRNNNEENGADTYLEETGEAEEATEDSSGKRREREEEVAAINDVKRKRDNASFLSAKEAYSALYLPIETYEFKDKYVKMFIDKHNDDDWVIPFNKKVFEPLLTEVKPYAELNNSKVFPGFAKLGLYMAQDCSRNDFICEYMGEVDFQKSYLMDPRNHYRIWGTTKPRVLFHPHWPIHIDARLCGNVARYMRRSCTPNVELATIRMPVTNELKFVLRATKDIETGDEIQADWHWDLRHPIWQVINGTATFDSMNDADKYLLIHSVDTVLGACDCACGSNNKDCNLQKVRKFSQSLYRTVKSKMNNRYKLNEILNQYQGKKRRQPPILTRLAKEALENEERAPKVLEEFNDRKLRTLAAGASAIGDIESSAKNTIKPYKWSLMDKQHTNNGLATTSSTSIPSIDPCKYDESEVNDFAKLPIPIALEVPLKMPTGTDSGKRDSLIGSKPAAHSPDAQTSAADTSTSASARIKTEERSHSSSSVSLPELSDSAKGALKKKLSFADYRKKQHR